MAFAAAAPELVKAAKETNKQILGVIDGFLNGASKIKDKCRHLEIGLSNETYDSLELVDSTFYSGRYWAQPDPDMSHKHIQAFGICNKDGGFMTGVSMHQTWKIGNSGYYLGVALSAPYSGSYKTKCGISKSSNVGKSMYDEMDDVAGKTLNGSYSVKWYRDHTKVTIVFAESTKC